MTDLLRAIERVALQTAPTAAARVMRAMPPATIALLQRARFRRTLRLAATRSSFYRDQFSRRGIRVDRVSHPSELGDFYTTGEDLRTHGPDAFLTGRAEVAFETTGTTSPIPKRVFFSVAEINAMGSASAAALHLLGLRREDRVLSAFDSSFWVSPAVTRASLQYIRCFHVEAGKIDPLDCITHAAAYRPTVLLGEPSWLVRFAEIARQRDVWPVKMIIAGGENMAEDARRTIEGVWQAPVYLNYGQTEAFGSLGLECRQQDGYHRNDLHIQYEIASPDADGCGDLVYTTLTRDVMPLIRYRSGDRTRLIDSPCTCGLFTGRLSKIDGRVDEMVVCGMGNIGPWVFEEILRDVPGLDHDWQAIISRTERRDIVALRLESPRHGEADYEALVTACVRRNLERRFPDFHKNLILDLYELAIQVDAPGSRRRGRKLRRVIDERHWD
jgi:phenylacetate-CoA ligase